MTKYNYEIISPDEVMECLSSGSMVLHINVNKTVRNGIYCVDLRNQVFKDIYELVDETEGDLFVLVEIQEEKEPEEDRTPDVDGDVESII